LEVLGMGLVFGYLAAMSIVVGFVCVLMKKHLPSALWGGADIVLVILSARNLRRIMVESGKVLTPELFGFGYHKPAAAVYAVMFVIGLIYMLLGAYGLIRNRATAAHS